MLKMRNALCSLWTAICIPCSCMNHGQKNSHLPPPKSTASMISVNQKNLLVGKRFSFGFGCTGKTHSEFTMHLMFLPDLRYQIEHVSEYNMGCRIKHIAFGEYQLTDTELHLTKHTENNSFFGSNLCPARTPRDVIHAYDYTDEGVYQITKCGGKIAFSRNRDGNAFVESETQR